MSWDDPTLPPDDATLLPAPRAGHGLDGPTLPPGAPPPGAWPRPTSPATVGPTIDPATPLRPAPTPAPPGPATWWHQPSVAPAPAPAPSSVRPMALGPGAVLGGDFELLEPLGEGGMGAVYRARQLSLGREVALKVLSLAPHLGPDAVERFLREARVAAAVSHPHVITVFAVGRDEPTGRLFMAIELVRGGDAAAAAHAAGGRLPERRALEVARDVAKGLTAIEAAGMVHRDIKPGNVLLAPDGTAKLADLGLARGLGDRLTQTGAVVGTPAFMSPEQAQGRQTGLDIGTDIYAVGATLYALLTGRPPYEAPSVINLLRLVLDAPPPDPRDVVPSVSAAAAAIVRRAMAKDRAARHATAAELVADLERALALPPQPPARDATPRRSRRALAALTLTLAVALAGIAWVALRPPRPGEAPASASPTTVPPREAPTPATAPAPAPATAPAPPPATERPSEPSGEAIPPAETTTLAHSWKAASPRSHPDLEITALERVGRHERGFLVLSVPGVSAVRARFRVRGVATWAQLRLDHVGTRSEGRTDCYIDVEVNGRAVVLGAAPASARVVDLTGVVVVGDNDLVISFRRESTTNYWLRELEVRYGSGPPPPPD